MTFSDGAIHKRSHGVSCFVCGIGDGLKMLHISLELKIERQRHLYGKALERTSAVIFELFIDAFDDKFKLSLVRDRLFVICEEGQG